MVVLLEVVLELPSPLQVVLAVLELGIALQSLPVVFIISPAIERDLRVKIRFPQFRIPVADALEFLLYLFFFYFEGHGVVVVLDDPVYHFEFL